MMREVEVVEAFSAALRADGWDVHTEVDFVDVVAERGDWTLYAEAKGTTSSPGLDVDTMYGQLLRRMPADERPGVRWAAVVPEHVLPAVLRVPASVRARLVIDVYSVSSEGQVMLSSAADDGAWSPPGS